MRRPLSLVNLSGGWSPFFFQSTQLHRAAVAADDVWFGFRSFWFIFPSFPSFFLSLVLFPCSPRLQRRGVPDPKISLYFSCWTCLVMPHRHMAQSATRHVAMPPSRLHFFLARLLHSGHPPSLVMKNKPVATTAIPLSHQILRSVAATAPHPVHPSEWATCLSAARTMFSLVCKKSTFHVDDMAIDPPEFFSSSAPCKLSSS
jgi:hypothetical protein